MHEVDALRKIVEFYCDLELEIYGLAINQKLQLHVEMRYSK